MKDVWKLTIEVPIDLKRRYKTVTAHRDISTQAFGLKAIQAAVEAAELEITPDRETAA